MAGRRHRVPPSVGYIINTNKERLSCRITMLLVAASILMSLNIMFLVQSQPSSEDILALSQAGPKSKRRAAYYREEEIDRQSFLAYARERRRGPPPQVPVYQEGSLKYLENDSFIIIRADGEPIQPAQDSPAKAPESRLEAAAQLPANPAGSQVKTGGAGPADGNQHALPAASNTNVKRTTPGPRKAAARGPAASSAVNLPAPKFIGKVRRSTLPPIDPRKSVTPNEILLRTAIGIKTFNRPECCYKTVKSFRKHYPSMAMFVADDSFDDVLSVNLTGEFDITYIRLAVDSGVGYGRNRLVDAIKSAGYQFMIMSDDDYTVEEPDLLLMMADRYVSTKADALGPIRCDYGHCERSLGMIHMSKSYELTVFPNMTTYPDEPLAPGCKRSDLLQQFFLAQTSALAAPSGWDDKLKNNDHYDFLFTAKKLGLKLVSCMDIKVMHNKKTCQDNSALIDGYLRVRAERWLNLVGHVFQKWKLSTLYDETGKEFKMVANSSAGGALMPVIKPPEKLVITRDHPDYMYYVNAVLDEHNQKTAGWYSYKELPNSRKTYIVRKPLNPCLSWIGGKLATRFDRHSSFPNKDMVHSFAFHQFNHSCPVSEDFWRLKSFGKEDRRHVFFVTAVSGDEVYMKRLLGYINNQTMRQYLSLVVVDMGNSKEKFDIDQIKMAVPVHYVYLGAPFSRSIGLRRGFDFAKQVAAEKGYRGAIGFSVDTSIVLPANFSEIVRQSVRCGMSTYAPVCYKSKDPGGYWVTTGYGMVGACFQDYDKVGGWDTRWGYRWGAEDVDIMNRLQAHVPYTVRTKEPGFYHQHSDSSRKSHSEYYKNKNMYDKPLPVTPLTQAITNPDLLQRIAAFAAPRMKYPIKLELVSAYHTPAGPQGRRPLIDARFVNSKQEPYFAIIESFF